MNAQVPAETPEFTAEFFGVRGSYPAVGPKSSKFGGNTPALCVTAAGCRLIFDAGLGLIPLGKKIRAEQNHAIFLSHLHYDHLTGLPFFAPLYEKGNRVRVCAPPTMVEALRVFWGPPYFPLRVSDLPAAVQILATPPGDLDLAELLDLSLPAGVLTMKTLFLDNSYHPADGVMLFRIAYAGKSLVYATDVEVQTDEQVAVVADFCQDADVLICDTQYQDKEYSVRYRGFGHNAAEMTIKLATAAQVKRLILFHHAPTRYDDAVDRMQAEVRKRFPASEAAYEGLVVTI